MLIKVHIHDQAFILQYSHAFNFPEVGQFAVFTLEDIVFHVANIFPDKPFSKMRLFLVWFISIDLSVHRNDAWLVWFWKRPENPDGSFSLLKPLWLFPAELFSSRVNHASYKADYWLFFSCFEVGSQLPTSQWSALERCRAIFTGVKIDSTKIIHGFLSMHLKNGAIHCGPEVGRSKSRMIWLATKADRGWEINWIHCVLYSLLSITLSAALCYLSASSALLQ